MIKVITKTSELEEAIARLSKSAYVTLDTEFIREKTYFPHLCLVQLGGPDEAVAIDPLARGMKLTPLYDLLANSKVLKVLHASRQDIEIFHHMAGFVPTPLFDTQIAAMVCGYGESVGYEPLVSKLVGVSLDKSMRFTDWAARPLSEKQVEYAIADVTHLRVVYEKLREQIEKSGRMSWIDEEMAELSSPSLYETDPEESWVRLRYRTKTPKYLTMLRELARWRELEAKKTNVPRGRVIKDETLLEIANSMPKSLTELERVRGFTGHLKSVQTKSLLAAIEKARSIDPADYMKVKPKKPLPEGVQGIVDLLRVLLKIKCEENGVAHRLVASKEDIEAIAQGSTEVPAMNGWRYTVFGQFAEALIKGKITLSVNAAKHTLDFHHT